MLSKSPSATAAAISPVPAATGAKAEPAAKAVEAPAPVSADAKKIVEDYKTSSAETIQAFANGAKRGMNEASKNITENEERIANTRKKATDQGRDLTEAEQNRIRHAQENIDTNKKLLDEEKTRFETLSNFENVKKQIAQEGAAKAIDAKKSEVAETVKSEEAKKNITTAQAVFAAQSQIGYSEGQKKMFAEFFDMSKEDSEKKKQSLAEEEASAQAANTAAAKARDAIEEKAELEGRKMTEAEEAQHKALGLELISSSNRLDAAKNAQKVLEKADEEKAFSAKIAANEEANAKEIAAFRSTQLVKDNAQDQENIQTTALAKTRENVNETLTINGKVVDPNSAEGKAALGKMEEAKAKMNQVMGGMMPDMSKMMAGGGKLTVNGKEVDPNSKEGQGAMASMKDPFVANASDKKVEQTKNMASMKDSMKSMMPDSKSLLGLDSLVKEISSGGVQSKEGLATMQAMGPEVATKFSNAVAAMQSATTADEKAKAKLQMDEAQASIAKRTQDKDFASMLTSGTKEQQEAAKALLQKSTVNQETKPSADSKGKTETTAKAVESHTIKAGETLSKIAKEAGISVQDIMKANPNIKDPNKIAAGASLNIPGAKKVEEAKPLDAKQAAINTAKFAEEDKKKAEADTAKKTEEAKKKDPAIANLEDKKVEAAKKKDPAIANLEDKKVEADTAKKTEEAKPKTTQEKKSGEVGYVTEQANKLTSGFGNIGAGNDMFNPKVVNKISDEEWAKIKEKQKSEGAPKTTTTTSAPKTSDAAPKKEEPKKEEPKKAEPAKTTTETAKPKAAETTLKDLNDQMIMLNRHMVELIKHSSTTADASNKTAKSAAKSTGRAF
jgi:hypothetical protein